MKKVITPNDYRKSLWKNSAGTTEEIFVFPANGELSSAFVFRLSVATIDGPNTFSDFSGYDRCIVPISDQSINLRHEEKEFALPAYKPYFFTGEMPTSCTLAGEATKDFNVITKRGSAAMHVDCKELYPQQYLQRELKAQWTAIYCAKGTVDVMVIDQKTHHQLDEHHTLIGERADLSGPITIRAGSNKTIIVVVEIELLSNP